MKVLQINSVCGIGSTGRIATDIHNILIKDNYNSTIAYGREPAKNCNNTIRIGAKYSNYLHVLNTRVFDTHGFFSTKETEAFIDTLRRLDPDVIHLHNIHGYYINVELLFEYLKAAKKPVIWTLHDCWSFTGHCAYFDYAECTKWKDGCGNCPEKKEYPSSWVLDNSSSNFIRKKSAFTGVDDLTIVTPSTWLAELAQQSYLNNYPIKVINNGIDLMVFKPVENNFRFDYKLEGKFIILGVASVWERRKGLKYFLEISKKLKLNQVIVLVGLNKKQCQELPSNIIGIMRTNNIKELVEIYSSADVFVNPTLEDNFPTTNIEALACGTPVVTFDTGGSGESVTTDVGYVVEKGNINQLLEAVNLVESKGKQYFTSAAVIRAKEKYNNIDKFNEYINIYKSKHIIQE